jgi:signal transduction histidine kinase
MEITNFLQSFHRRIIILSVVTAVLISLTMPLSYVVLQIYHERDTNQNYATNTAILMQNAVQENPDYWQYATHKLKALLETQPREPGIGSVAIYDARMNLLHEVQVTNQLSIFSPLTAIAEIHYGGKIVGYVQTQKNVDAVAKKGVLLFGFFSMLGLSLGYAIYYYPVQIVRQASQTVRQTMRELRTSRKEVVQSNQELSSALAIIEQKQAQMIQQEKLAGLGQMAAGVAHEINNPLAYVTNNTEMLVQYFTAFTILSQHYRQLEAGLKAADELQFRGKAAEMNLIYKEQHIDYIISDLPQLTADTLEGLKRISKIVKGMQIFTRVERHKTFAPYDLNQGVDATFMVTQHQIKQCAIVEEDRGCLPLIEVIGDEINQVLLNLVVNAVHAIQAKESGKMGVIRVATWCDAEFAYCSIADDGIGIAPENMKDLFNPFFTTKPVGQGTGLGLSLSYDIVVAHHHGEIEVESKEGEGAKFVLKLPINHASDKEESISPN